MDARHYSLSVSRSAQSGSALITSMIFLLVMTVLGVAAMRNSTMQERMSGNARDWNLAFQAAEAALREAEDYLLTTAILPDFNDTNGLYDFESANRPVWTGSSPSNGSGYVEYAADLDGTAQRPRYFIEQLSTIRPAGVETETGVPLDDISFFRVTAVGYGGAIDNAGDPVASVVLSTVYRNR
jgi:type IV pilus assembly protein PilX